MVHNVAPLDLPAVEAGAFRGGSAFFMATAFLSELGHEVPIDVVDTFEGHPEDRLSDADDPTHKAGYFGGTSYEEVRAYLSRFERVTGRKGGDLAGGAGAPARAARAPSTSTWTSTDRRRTRSPTSRRASRRAA